MRSSSIDRPADLLYASRFAVAFTGAGVSTESGLPDFRSPGGLWQGVDPMRVASLSAFQRRPADFYAFYMGRLAMLGEAEPNPAHHALARMESTGLLRGVITQNVDGLHQRAGSRRVLEIHGSLSRAACDDCAARTDISVLANALASQKEPRCDACGGLLRPDVVLFEELLPVDVFEEAEKLCCSSDLLLVVGSSLQVTPAAFLPQATLDHGGALIIVNREPTPFDGAAAVVLRDNAGTALTQLALRAADRGARPPLSEP